MFKKASSTAEIEQSFASHFHSNAEQEIKDIQLKNANAQYLTSLAVKILDELKLTKEAQEVEEIMSGEPRRMTDPHSEGFGEKIPLQHVGDRIKHLEMQKKECELSITQLESALKKSKESLEKEIKFYKSEVDRLEKEIKKLNKKSK